jgi:hypothetical protein
MAKVKAQKDKQRSTKQAAIYKTLQRKEEIERHEPT